MGFIYFGTNLMGSMNEKGHVLINNDIVGLAKDGKLYNSQSKQIGSYNDGHVYDINNNEIGIVDKKGDVIRGDSYAGNVSGCDDTSAAAAALLLLIDFRPDYTLFTDFTINDNKNFMIKASNNILKYASNLDNNVIVLDEGEDKVNFKKIELKLDIFIEPIWEEFLSICITNKILFNRILGFYPDIIKFIKKHYDFDRDNHYLNFIVGYMSLTGEYTNKNTTFGIHELFKSAYEGYELAIKYCTHEFSGTNLISELDAPLKIVYVNSLTKEDIEEMMTYLEKKFSGQDEAPTKKVTFRNCYKKINIGPLTVDNIHLMNDVAYSDSWLNVVACILAEGNYEESVKLFDLIPPLAEAVLNANIIDNTRNVYFECVYGLMLRYGIKVLKDEIQAMTHLVSSATHGYDLAIEALKDMRANLDYLSLSKSAKKIVKSRREEVLKNKDELLKYLNENLKFIGTLIPAYNDQVLFIPSQEKLEGKKKKVSSVKTTTNSSTKTSTNIERISNDETKSKKGLFIGLGVLAAIVIVVVIIILALK